jgi:hypothetical protein
MNMPHFNAEVSLYVSQARYRSSGARNLFAGTVTPSWIPSGTYQQSCVNCITQTGEDDYLFCQCKDTSGNLNYTAIAYDWCIGDIGNCNGKLCCYDVSQVPPDLADPLGAAG